MHVFWRHLIAQSCKKFYRCFENGKWGVQLRVKISHRRFESPTQHVDNFILLHGNIGFRFDNFMVCCIFQVASDITEELSLKPEDVFLGQGEFGFIGLLLSCMSVIYLPLKARDMEPVSYKQETACLTFLQTSL